MCSIMNPQSYSIKVESDVNSIHPQSSHNLVVVSQYNLLMEGIKIYQKIYNIFIKKIHLELKYIA